MVMMFMLLIINSDVLKDLFVLLLVASFVPIAIQSNSDSQEEMRKNFHLDFDLFLITCGCRKCQT